MIISQQATVGPIDTGFPEGIIGPAEFVILDV
jgi:hypothetical protein